MPARTRRKSIRPRANQKPKNRTLVRFFVIVFVVTLGVFVYLLSTIISKKEKVTVAYFDDGGASVLVLDPKLESITKLHIPGDTQLDMAYNLGVTKLKNLEKVSQNERVGSLLLAKTLTNNLQVPIPYYSAKNLNKYFEGSIIGSLIGGVTTKDTNISLMQRISLAVFSSKVVNSKRISLDITEYAFVTADKLVDGTEGYVITRDTPISIASIVSDSRFSNSNFTARIYDSIEDKILMENVVRTIKNSGLIVTSIEDANSDVDCLIKSRNTELLDYYSTLYVCDSQLSNTETDIEFLFGTNFQK